MAASHAVGEVHFSQPDDDYNIVLVLFIYLFRSSNTPREPGLQPNVMEFESTVQMSKISHKY